MAGIRIQSEQSVFEKIKYINWGLIILITMIASVGFLCLYSAAGGSLDPWASKQMVRFAFGVVMMIGVALVDIRVWFRLSWIYFGFVLLLLIYVDIAGHIGMGAQRWINLGFI